VKTVMNYQVFFNRNIIKENKLDFAKIKQSVVDVLKEDSCVQYACDMEKTMTESIPEDVKMRIVNGYNRERSGDVAIVLKPNFYAHGMKGTDHGEWNPYDTHIPLVFHGLGNPAWCYHEADFHDRYCSNHRRPASCSGAKWLCRSADILVFYLEPYS
jgi:hypothetical protein